MKINNIKNTALVVICLLLVIPNLVYSFPFLVGAGRSYTVMSGSMSPSLNPGDLVIVKEADPVDIEVGDILSVKSRELVYTHRVVEKKLVDSNYLFKLKGDANENPDPSYIEASNIIGKVCLVLPFSILYSPFGYVLIVLAPLALLAVNQAINIYKFMDRSKRRRRGFKAILLGKGGRRRVKKSILGSTSILLFLILVAGSTRVMAPYLGFGSLSFFSDTEMIHCEFTTGQWFIEATVDIDPDKLNLNSKGQWITCYIELPEPHGINDIDISTVTLNHKELVANAEPNPTEIGDYDGDGIPDLMVKFDRETIVDYLIDEGYGDGEEVTFKVTGEFTDETLFQGSDRITLIQEGTR